MLDMITLLITKKIWRQTLTSDNRFANFHRITSGRIMDFACFSKRFGFRVFLADSKLYLS